MRRRRRAGLTLIEVLIAVVLLVIVLLVALVVGRQNYVRPCQNNLKQLGIALRLYLDGQGRRTQWPDGDGSDFLIKLYTSGVATDPGLYLCPATSDDNDRGRDLRPSLGRMPTNAVSYAGRRNALNGQHSWPGLFTTRVTCERSQASDDDEGPGARYNHGRINMLFADGHVELFELDAPYVKDRRIAGPRPPRDEHSQPEGTLETLGN